MKAPNKPTINLIFIPLCIVKHKTITSSIPIRYTKCCNVNIFHLKELLALTNNIVLIINVRDTLRPLGI